MNFAMAAYDDGEGTLRAAGKGPHDAYPVRTVARLTGLSPDVIRAWEKRYGVVAPIRGPRGARLYTANDVAHLRLLARVVSAGRAIGDVAGLDRPSLEVLAGETERRAVAVRGPHRIVDEIVRSLQEYDARRVERQLGDALIGLGSRAFIGEVAAPLLREVGDRWSAGQLSVAAEHLCSGLLRNLLSGLIQTREKSAERCMVLATTSGERHEFGLLLVGLLAIDGGLGLYYLGVDLPAAEIITAARRDDVAVVGISLVNDDNTERAVDETRKIEVALFPSAELWLGGRSAPGVSARLGATQALVIQDLAAVEAELLRVRSATGPARH